MSTDSDWERWGQQDPYFGVLSHDRFRRANLTGQARAEFLATGRAHVDYVLDICRQRVDPRSAPTRVLDFGCGVGRLVIPFAAQATDVVGVDISPSMLAEARRNCDDAGASNVRLLLSDDALTAVEGDFDLVHSCIVLQHIEPTRGRALFHRLIERIRPGGLGALHVTFGWDYYAATLGRPPPVAPAPALGFLQRLQAPFRSLLSGRAPVAAPVADGSATDPEMQMYFYDLNELLFIVRQAGAERIHAEFTDHGGVLGTFLFFRKGG